ncbi:MAG: hypothetical protein PHO02_07400 [Candidatus Nanoarchaeia archaeon]|nr:hypothetical protein [Candidatus Nanoarchaeia archaeon]
MLEKISGVREIKEKLDSVEKRMSVIELNMQKQGNEVIAKIEKEVHEIKNLQHGYVSAFSKDLEKIKELQAEFEKALRTFHQNHNQLYESVYSKLHKEVKEHTLPLKEAVAEFSALKPEAKKLIESLGAVNEGIAKLNIAAQGIKKEDFELKTYAKELLKADSEKLRLMKEIETLKRIISFERRKQR